jgi:hypothetical protein
MNYGSDFTRANCVETIPKGEEPDELAMQPVVKVVATRLDDCRLF